jgi:hypothetical protein
MADSGSVVSGIAATAYPHVDSIRTHTRLRGEVVAVEVVEKAETFYRDRPTIDDLEAYVRMFAGPHDLVEEIIYLRKVAPQTHPFMPSAKKGKCIYCGSKHAH